MYISVIYFFFFLLCFRVFSLLIFLSFCLLFIIADIKFIIVFSFPVFFGIFITIIYLTIITCLWFSYTIAIGFTLLWTLLLTKVNNQQLINIPVLVQLYVLVQIGFQVNSVSNLG